MVIQRLVQQRIPICCIGLYIVFSFLLGSTNSAGQDLDSNTKAAQNRELENEPSHSTSEEVVIPSLIRNRRSNAFADNEQLYGNDAELNSAFLYNDEIMQNLMNSPPSKPMNYARSNFFLNYLKPRTTRYSPWDDHSLMHFGKRSLDNSIDNEKVLVKRSAEFWSPDNVLHFGKKSENSGKADESPQNIFDREGDNFDIDSNIKTEESDISNLNTEKEEYSQKSEAKKSTDPWHSMMSFGKKSQNPWDHNTMHFGKRDEPWHNIISFGKKSDPWHNMMSFGKKDEPWHNMMSFGKRFENLWDHNTLHFGKRYDWDHNTLHFGKRDPWNHNTLHFGKREPWDHNTLHFGKRTPWDHNTLHFGKRDPWDHNTMHFGKRDPWDHNTLHFGKRDEPWHNMMSFGKKDDPWHNMMSFGKKSENYDMTDLEKRNDPWHNMMSFGKKSNVLWNNSDAMVDKRDEPWHSMMSFGKKADYTFDHNTMHFGKKDEPWHSMMSFGKRSGSPWDHGTLHFGKRDEPWHSMMSFGKRADGSIDDLSEDFVGNIDPWYEFDGMMFYKKSSPWDHNTLHVGKRSNESFNSAPSNDEVNSNHIKKRSADMWNDHHTMHFGKKFDPWDTHNTMHFGKKSDSIEKNNPKSFEDIGDINKVENIDKKFDWDSHNTMHFGKREPEDNRNTFLFDKRDPWDYHNTMHFGKRNPWDYHNTMHFGKRNPWDYHNTMHFGKRDWDYHNTMHFGKRNPWEHHNTMHFGKRSDLDLKDEDISTTAKSIDVKENENSNTRSEKGSLDRKIDKEELNIRKRSSVNAKTQEKSNDKKILLKTLNKVTDNSKLMPHRDIDIKQPLENFKSIIVAKKDGKDLKSSITEKSPVKDLSNSPQENNKKSRIQKRSVKENSNANINLANKYTKDSIADNVLHFGKRSVEISDDDEEQWIDEENEKRADDFWNDHDTLHFGKKSDFWDNHNTLHFGKKSSPQEVFISVPSAKRDPWEHLNTLHFGKRFDPWDGHDKMHFGKRTDSWDHNVMHFGKRNELPPSEFEVLSNLDDLVKLKSYLQSLNTEQDDIVENNDLSNNLINLKTIINSHLKDDSIPFENRVSLLKFYVRPIIKAIIDAEGAGLIPFPDPSDNENERMKDIDKDDEDIFAEPLIIPQDGVNKLKYDEAIFKKGNDDSSYGEYGDNFKKEPSESENLVKSKRKYLGKPELKRYFVPFQGPKSIVYPHAWFASQIRRSSLPRTTDYARHMEMRMAEKKEDPFNSYMHFGRR